MAAVRTMELVSVVTVPSAGRPQTCQLLLTTWPTLQAQQLTPLPFSGARAPLINSVQNLTPSEIENFLMGDRETDRGGIKLPPCH